MCAEQNLVAAHHQEFFAGCGMEVSLDALSFGRLAIDLLTVRDAIGNSVLIVAPMVETANNGARAAIFGSQGKLPMGTAVLEGAQTCIEPLDENRLAAKLCPEPVVDARYVGKEPEEHPVPGQRALF